ncbi:MAG: hypothetical protein Q9M32_01880 [Sulfurimonas sp.]|nr:hypothetical protein [Sulfurimonas sp.]MDQ7060339.1 hypothetical protein [Sulfurimonas sp.]
MYTVEVGFECSCFKKSDYESKKSFDNQSDAYNYANVLADFMNDDFCATHTFSAIRSGDKEFIIQVFDNPEAAGSCSTGISASAPCDEDTCGCS